MLIHTSQSKGAHSSLGALEGALGPRPRQEPDGPSEPSSWTKTRANVCEVRQGGAVSFDELILHLSENHQEEKTFHREQDDTSDAPDL
jgi:hypothetical protein